MQEDMKAALASVVEDGGEAIGMLRAQLEEQGDRARKKRERARRRKRKPKKRLAPRLPREVSLVGRKVSGTRGQGFVREVFEGEFAVKWEPCDGHDERVSRGLVCLGEERVDGEQVVGYVGRSVKWEGVEGKVVGYLVGAELFRVRFPREVRDPQRREAELGNEWFLPAERVQPLFFSPFSTSVNSRAHARRSPGSPDSAA